MALKGLI
jgi:CCAAT-binding transcription factor (CBF-B/NF-YA) subunit B